MKKICIILTYFGNWPTWFPAFLLSCEKNEKNDWLIFTDCGIPDVAFSNIKFIRFTLAQLNTLASEKLGIRIKKGRYSQVDLHPAAGMIFEDYLAGYDFWGHCDIDVIWGDIRTFITAQILDRYDIISSRKNRLAGHFTLWKNNQRINTLFRTVPNYQAAFANPDYSKFDEKVMSQFLNETKDAEDIYIFWSKNILVDWPELEACPKGWYWRGGKIYDGDHHERFYVHFMTWKKHIKRIDFCVGEPVNKFTITRRGVWSKRPPMIERFWEATQLLAWAHLRPNRVVSPNKKSRRLARFVHFFQN